MIQNLRARLEEKDPVSGEYHPKKESLAAELDYAEDILNNKDLAGSADRQQSGDKGK